MYTGNPVGTYVYGDKHPSLELWFIGYSGKYEKWVDRSAFERSVECRRLVEAAQHRKPKKRVRWPVNTGKPVGHWRRGDPHPSRKGYVFGQYVDGKERWLSPNNKSRKKAIRASEGRSVCKFGESSVYMREHRKLKRMEAEYERMYHHEYRNWKSWRQSLRPKLSKSERRRLYRQNNPAERAARRLSRKMRKQEIREQWKELWPYERKLANDLYKFRDILNAIHGKIVYVIDHIHPLAKGGMHHPFNLQLATYAYNEAKSDKIGPLQYS